MSDMSPSVIEQTIPAPARNKHVIMGSQSFISVLSRAIVGELYKIRRRKMSKVLGTIAIITVILASIFTSDFSPAGASLQNAFFTSITVTNFIGTLLLTVLAGTIVGGEYFSWQHPPAIESWAISLTIPIGQIGSNAHLCVDSAYCLTHNWYLNLDTFQSLRRPYNCPDPSDRPTDLAHTSICAHNGTQSLHILCPGYQPLQLGQGNCRRGYKRTDLVVP